MAGTTTIGKVKELRQLVDLLGAEIDVRKLESILNALELQVDDGNYHRYAVTRLCEALLATAELYDISEQLGRQLENDACALVEDRR